MKWPWMRSRGQRDRLVFAWADGELAYVQAHKEGAAQHRVQRFGVLRRLDGEDDAAWAGRVAKLGFKGMEAIAMLRLGQYQMLQIETPAVAPEELRTAARWQIRDLVSQHVDDLTLDVLKIAENPGRGAGSLLVVAASNEEVRAVMEIAQVLQCTVHVIDIRDTAQRNLQTAAAQQMERAAQAQAAIVVVRDQQALLTIAVQGELYYTRRIDLGEGFLQDLRSGAQDAAEPEQAWSVGGLDTDRSQRLVVEVQRSLDLWERTWPSTPLDRIMVYAGERSAELSAWLGQELGQAVWPMDVAGLFPGFEGGSDEDQRACWPLLGVLLRGNEREL